ncbi:MAG: TonB-dependent receptor [Novosphingobium sp.]|uniref:TonB-dependent receptor domain-containing protein n=1 Tax=Novosphingobium sp. TaxID=1874826 RepID=UPI002734CAA0|nr:TonB-dependent receptor [Novosphingobium sp.]MDP3549060.1 TonB-dependent receptor [Novosphingobium sp.]
MRKFPLLVATLLATTMHHTAWAADESAAPAAGAAEEASSAAPAKKAFSTGVAKGRDLLDTAISASVIDEADLAKLSVSSVSGIMQNIPGIRSLTADVDGYSSITVRGLPLAADGSKFLQLQEDGLPVLEFGDINFSSVDRYVRADFTLSQIQSIRGGSASTFASNSPGGVVNLISKTGEVEGGNLQVSTGVGHELKRIDFDYGSPLGDDWRFHVGGFYREGEGPRDLGYTAFRGGQIKMNVTRKFAGGYIRFYGKYLDDRQPNYGTHPSRVTGTDSSPVYTSIPGTDVFNDSFASPRVAQYLGVDGNNNPVSRDLTDGLHAVVKAVGLETQFEVAGWSVSDRFRYASISGELNQIDSMLAAPSPVVSTILGGPGSSLTYASGPNAGTVLAPGNSINGNGLASINVLLNIDQNSLDNVTNDLRASRVFDLQGGKLTTSFGLYNSMQEVNVDWNFTNAISDVVGNGQMAPLDLRAADGTLLTQNGVYSYGFGFALPRAYGNYGFDVRYKITAPYASVNFASGKISVGASVRYDRGNVSGNVLNTPFVGPKDLNGDGVLAVPETSVALLPLTTPINVDYDYKYVSYSTGINYRIAEPISAFARYSRGGRASADRVLTEGMINPTTGKLANPDLAFGTVKQAEAGLKFRKDDLALYVTGFWASTEERNSQIGANANGQVVVINVVRSYSAKGVELEADYKRGPFGLTLGGTWTKAQINGDAVNPQLEGNRPRYIPEFSFMARPTVDLDAATFGAVINGTTSSFAQDVNQLTLPGYVLVSPFLHFRPAPKVTLGINAFNVFDKRAIYTAASATIPASGVVNIQTMNGRTVTASLRYTF